jgi:hypothetical protein
MLAAPEDLGMDVWGERLPVIETVARLLSIYLNESLSMRGPSQTGWWVYRGGGFDPIAPWERHREGH